MTEMFPPAAEHAAPSPMLVALGLACLGVAAGSVLAIQLSAWSWWADLITFFVPWVAVAVAIAAAAALWAAYAEAGKPVVLDLAVLTVMAALAFVALAVSSSREAKEADPNGFSVMTYNVQGYNERRGPVIEAIRKASPDILFLQECEGAWKDGIASLGYSGRALLDGKRQSVEVLSRFPVVSAERIPFVPTGGAPRLATGYRVVVMVPSAGGEEVPLVLYAIHPPTPRTHAGWLARNAYLAKVAQLVAAEPEGSHVVVAGDWNVSTWSGSFRDFLSAARMEVAGGPEASRVFWRKWGFTFGSPVDHIAASAGIEVSSYRVERPDGNTSDHDPVAMFARIRPAD